MRPIRTLVVLALTLLGLASHSFGQGPVIRFNSYPAPPFTCDQSAISGGMAPSYFDTTLNSLQICTSTGWVTVPGTSPTFPGQILLPYGSSTAPSIGWQPDADGTPTGIYAPTVNSIGFLANGQLKGKFTANGLSLGTPEDTILDRDAAGTLAQRNSTSAQAFRVYKTFTDASNGSWLEIDAGKTTTNVLSITTRFNGTGTRSLPVYAGSFVKALTAASATNIILVSSSNPGECGGTIDYGVVALDATPDRQYRSGRVHFQQVEKAGVATCVVSGLNGTANPTETMDGSSIAQSSASTLTYTWGSTAGGNCFFTLNAASGLTETTLEIRYKVSLNESFQAGSCTVAPQ